MSNEATAMAVSRDLTAFEPGSVGEGMELAKLLHKGGLLPASIRSPEAAFTVIVAGREFGFTAMQSLRSIHFFDGKIVMAADAMVGIVRRHTECEYFRMIESTDKVATFETKRKGDPEPTKLSFTIEQAARAGLLGKNNWKAYPEAMLRARCQAALCRLVYQDKLAACYDPEEVEGQPVRVQVETKVVPPKHDPETGEVYSEAQQIAEAERLIDLINVATDAKSLKAVGDEVKSSFDKGKIGESQRLAISAIYVRKKASITEGAAAPPPPPPPPQSETKVVDAQFEEEKPS